jgi:hypothetical protein
LQHESFDEGVNHTDQVLRRHRYMSHENSIEAALRAYVDAGALAGAATLVWRDGRVVHSAIVGSRDLVTNLPVERDTIFRIASMTKPLTTVAALMLYDEGRFALDEPIARLAPELARPSRPARSEWSSGRNGCGGAADHVRRSPDAPLRPHLRRVSSWPDLAPAPKLSEGRWTMPSAR